MPRPPGHGSLPFEQPAAMAEAIVAAGGEARLQAIAGGRHGFDYDTEDARAAGAVAEAVQFLGRRLPYPA